MMTALSHRLPNRLAQQCFQRVVNAVAAALLRAGRVGMSGTAPNGQSFAWGPRRIWTIASPDNYTSSIAGYPKRGLFAVGDSAFENFDPTQHALPSAPKVKSQTGRKDS
jgi:hypothetical protein